ncbi:MAG: hypothetical protein Q4F11_09865 [Eubacteriales bacterium]|nr:hypothetical protein [Eubacteriales bacterium]
MDNKTSNIRQSSMFLIELIIAVLFLSLCSAICIRLFINARITASDSYNLTQSVTAAQNIAEVFESGVSSCQTELESYISSSFNGSNYMIPDSTYTQSSYKNQPSVTIYYDENFQPCTASSCSYSAYVFIQYQSFMVCADIFIRKAESPADYNEPGKIYSLHVDHAKNPEPYSLSDKEVNYG